MSTYLEELKEQIKEETPSEVMLTKVEAEGPDLVLYSKDISKLLNNGGIIKNLAGKFKKRFVPRSDESMLEPPERAEEMIKEIVPADADIKSIEFNPDFNEVVITADKLGLVIGKRGKTIKKINIKTGWKPKLQRIPTGESTTLEAIRKMMINESSERKKILEELGEKIYRKPPEEIKWVKLTSLGASREVGRSCFLLETPNSKIMLDCGIKVGVEGEGAYPLLSTINFSLDELDAVVVSHAHLDHGGFVPYLYNYGYEGPVYSTEPTRDLMTLLQKDYVKITKREGRKLPYSEKNIKKEIMHSVTKGYGEVTDITPDMRLTLYNAGHILGSSISHVHIGEGEHNLIYTGDLKFGYTELLNPAHTRFPRAETLIMESTYGGQKDKQQDTRQSKKKLMRIVKETTEKNGLVLIPVFGVGRAQAIMLILEENYRKGNFNVPVYLDGMTKEASAIHTAYPEFLKRNVKKRILHGDSPFDSKIFQRVDSRERDEIVDRGKAVILSPSGMMTGGPVLSYFKQTCEDSKNSLVFVGYQGQRTLGRKIEKKPDKIAIPNKNGKMKQYDLNMKVEKIKGFSGHADINELLGYFKKVNPTPKKLLTVHGEENKCKNLAKSINYKFHVDTQVLHNLDSLRLR